MQRCRVGFPVPAGRSLWSRVICERKHVDTCSLKTSNVTFIAITEEYMLAVKTPETTDKPKENKSPSSHHFLMFLCMISRTLFDFFPFKMKSYYKC